MYDALLFLHVLGAFVVVTAVVIYSAAVLGANLGRGVLTVANLCWDVGGGLVFFLGIWLVFEVDTYDADIWDGWVLGALVLFLIATELGRRARLALEPAVEGADPATSAPRLTLPSQAVTIHWLRTAAVIGVLVLMIYKPGA